MSQCKYCGGTLEFRTVGGRPIAFAGTCSCETDPGAFREKESFCRPTKCPHCSRSVYFLRHNGGSVWLDEPGWSWPKHGCFLKDNPEVNGYPIVENLRTACEKQKSDAIPQISRVVAVENLGTFVGFIVALRDTKDGYSFWRAIPPIVGSIRVGNLVALYAKERVIVTEGPVRTPILGPFVKCKACGDWVKRSTLRRHLTEHEEDWAE